MSAPIEVYFWPTPNGRKITIACEEMGLPYTLKPVDIGRGDQFKPEFLAISPNNRMPAIVDPEGPDGKPISVFESGAILQYLGRKTGKFYPADERARVEVDEWLFWQMAGLGPMAGQANHFRFYAPTMAPDSRMTAYGVVRYTNEVERLFGVLNKRLKGREYVCGDYSIADMAIWPWTRGWKSWSLDLANYPDMKAWFERMEARPAVKAAVERGEEMRRNLADNTDEAAAARSVLFGQRARA
ncbi:MAG TPA: glutathione S-transferase N-terminal domain-containing protein [Caulobacteraceae bacterium]|jgi:glutathione S-transferase/GST-like protein|nr:glutathione S-transferase N-terminal domain-containing protein [Caulobacteraceae bacterium]